MIYKIKHQPTGLYYQPHKHRGSNLSKNGKVYQTPTHGLSSAFKSKRDTFSVFVEKDSKIHQLTKDLIDFVDCKWAFNQLKGTTYIKDWVKEEIS